MSENGNRYYRYNAIKSARRQPPAPGDYYPDQVDVIKSNHVHVY